MNRNRTATVLFIVLLLGVSVMLIQIIQSNATRQPLEQETIGRTETQTETDTTPDEPPPSASAQLMAGGSSYMDPQKTFSFLYPSEYTLDESDPVHPRVYKTGQTQRPQSEMSDGALLVFEVVELRDLSLEAFVEARIAELTADGTSQLTQQKRAIQLQSYPGFTYQMRGLGESTTIFVQKDLESETALSITYLVSDPQQKGYQEEVDSILATLVLHK